MFQLGAEARNLDKANVQDFELPGVLWSVVSITNEAAKRQLHATQGAEGFTKL